MLGYFSVRALVLVLFLAVLGYCSVRALVLVLFLTFLGYCSVRAIFCERHRGGMWTILHIEVLLQVEYHTFYNCCTVNNEILLPVWRLESQTQFFYTDSTVVYIVIQGRLSKPLLAELLCWVPLLVKGVLSRLVLGHVSLTQCSILAVFCGSCVELQVKPCMELLVYNVHIL